LLCGIIYRSTAAAGSQQQQQQHRNMDLSTSRCTALSSKRASSVTFIADDAEGWAQICFLSVSGQFASAYAFFKISEKKSN